MSTEVEGWFRTRSIVFLGTSVSKISSQSGQRGRQALRLLPAIHILRIYFRCMSLSMSAFRWKCGLQARDLCERPRGFIFGKAMRNDLGKLFLGKDAVAYITSNTPGPGAYELGWQRPVFLFPSREPGTTIGGPLANVDRVQTGPLGAAYRSDTPGPGAYNETNDRGTRNVPTRRSCYSTGGSASCWSRSDPGRASTRGIVSFEYCCFEYM